MSILSKKGPICGHGVLKADHYFRSGYRLKLTAHTLSSALSYRNFIQSGSNHLDIFLHLSGKVHFEYHFVHI